MKKTARKLKPMPKLRKGKYTALQVLNHVVRLAKAEPRRLRMRTWVSALKGIKRDRGFRGQLPACGTTACIGGWVNLLVARDEYGTGWSALNHLNLPQFIHDEDGFRNYNTPYIELLNLMGEHKMKATYAIKRLEAYIERHKAYLKTREVEVQ